MTYAPNRDYYQQVIASELTGKSIEHKFGRAVVGTTYTPVCYGGVMRTPQPAAATQLRIKAGNSNDTAAGSGAREITIFGIDASGDLVSEAIATAGASASANSSNSYIRLLRAYVSSSGTYATTAAGSHAADIVIENAAGTQNWATIALGTFARSQSEIGFYTVPNSKVAYILEVGWSIDTAKTNDVLLFQRQSILDAAAPYEAARLILNLTGLTQGGSRTFKAPLGPYPANTDIGFLAKVSATTSTIETRMELLVEDA